jgi:predicted DCC family thiol-disulfide oxidoreductase YuxK
MTPSTDDHTVPGTGTFLYDRDCGFCQRAVVFARELLRSRTAFTAWQEFDLDRFGLTPEQADELAWLVYPDGRRFAGGDAIAEVLVHSRLLARPVGRMMRLPLLRSVNRLAYRAVAANRHRFPGGSPSCAAGPSQ